MACRLLVGLDGFTIKGVSVENQKCDDCGFEFVSISYLEDPGGDREYVVEQKTCDIVDGQYIEWFQIVCPKCSNVVCECGR